MDLDFCDNCKKTLTKEEHYFKVENKLDDYDCKECYNRLSLKYTEHGKYIKLLHFVQMLSFCSPYTEKSSTCISAGELLKEIGEDKF